MKLERRAKLNLARQTHATSVVELLRHLNYSLAEETNSQFSTASLGSFFNSRRDSLRRESQTPLLPDV